MCKYCDSVTAAAKAYKAKWPKSCPKCGGAGEHNWYEDVAGDGGSRMPMGDYCDYCVGQGKCPRCGELQSGEEWGADINDTCWNCGWKSGDEACPVLDMCPEEESRMFDDIPDESILWDETELLHDAVERALSREEW